MKKAAIIFAIIFVLTLAIPIFSLNHSKSESKQSELVTIFSSPTNLSAEYHLPFEDRIQP